MSTPMPTSPVLQTNKIEARKVKWLAQGHSAGRAVITKQMSNLDTLSVPNSRFFQRSFSSGVSSIFANTLLSDTHTHPSFSMLSLQERAKQAPRGQKQKAGAMLGRVDGAFPLLPSLSGDSHERGLPCRDTGIIFVINYLLSRLVTVSNFPSKLQPLPTSLLDVEFLEGRSHLFLPRAYYRTGHTNTNEKQSYKTGSILFIFRGKHSQ